MDTDSLIMDYCLIMTNKWGTIPVFNILPCLFLYHCLFHFPLIFWQLGPLLDRGFELILLVK